MSTRTAHAAWQGGLVEGFGEIRLSSSGLGPFPTSLAARAADQTAATGPEELLAAAHAACYAMQLAALLGENGAASGRLDIDATVTQGGPEVDFGITGIQLGVSVEADLPADRLAELVVEASHRCPVGRALAAVPVSVELV